MSCGAAFGKPRRICALDPGHAGDHAGGIDKAVFREARQAARAMPAPAAEPEAARNARLLLEAAQRFGSGTAWLLLCRAGQIAGHPLLSRGAVLRTRETRQILFKLCKEGKLIADGEEFSPAA